MLIFDLWTFSRLVFSGIAGFPERYSTHSEWANEEIKDQGYAWESRREAGYEGSGKGNNQYFPPLQSTVDYGIRYLHCPYSGFWGLCCARVCDLLLFHLWCCRSLLFQSGSSHEAAIRVRAQVSKSFNGFITWSLIFQAKRSKIRDY